MSGGDQIDGVRDVECEMMMGAEEEQVEGTEKTPAKSVSACRASVSWQLVDRCPVTRRHAQRKQHCFCQTWMLVGQMANPYK